MVLRFVTKRVTSVIHPCIGVNCDDGNTCNGIEICDSLTGECLSGTPLVCDDGEYCNGDETCDPTNGCQSGTPVVCDDGAFCNGI
jgi:hypothetical protein